MNEAIKNIYKTIRFGGSKFECNICGRGVRKFFPFSNTLLHAAKKNGFIYDFERIETLNLSNCNCPFCFSTDRERLYALFIEEHLRGKLTSEIKMLDFAPNKAFSNYFKNIKNLKYTSADLYKEDVDIKLNICNMASIKDSSFDIVICSHILEHVDNPEMALTELHRILKQNGIAIIMVPIFWDVVETIEEKSFTSKEERCKLYGQEDHVRLFSKADFTSKIRKAGFQLKEYSINDFQTNQIKKHAIALNSVLYIGTK